MVVRRLVAAWISVLTLVAPSAKAQGAATNAPCSVGQRAALSELACELSQRLTGLPSGLLVVSEPLVTDVPTPRADELSRRLADVVAGALGRQAASSTEPARLGRARALASRAGTLVLLSPELARGELRVVANVYPVPRAFWDRVRDPTPNPSQHAFVTRRLDPELRTFLPPVPLVARRIERASSPEPFPLAVACGDVTGDGAQEIALVGRHRVQIGRVRGGAFAPLAQVAWKDLSPVSRSPLREPIGSAALWAGPGLDVGISDRLDAVRLGPDLSLVAKLGRRLPWPAGGCSRIAGLSLRPEIEACDPRDGPLFGPLQAAPADAIAGARVLQRDGSSRMLRAWRTFGESSATVSDGKRSARVEAAGAQLALGDLDGDGTPELVSSADTLDPTADAVIVHSWQADGTLVERLRVGVPTGVHALAVCASEDAGLAPVVVATRGGVWLIR